MNSFNKQNNDMLKKCRKEAQLFQEAKDETEELKNQLEGMKKEQVRLDEQAKELEKETQRLLDEQHIFVGALVRRGLDSNKAKLERARKNAEIEQFKSQVAQLEEQESKLKIEIVFLGTIREKMARTASQAMAQAKETIEELKVKELLILDLLKKQQETEFRLNTFQALYEDVKNMRNKYVAQIASSSQDLAEMKERIKILQNEVEILRNESADKDIILEKYNKRVQEAQMARDKHRAELNKKEFLYKSKMSIIG